MSKATTTEPALRKRDIVVQTRGRRAGRIGQVRYVREASELLDRAEPEYRVEWTTGYRARPPRVWSEKHEALAGLASFAKGHRTSSTCKASTLAGYGLVRLAADDVREWRDRFHAIEREMDERFGQDEGMTWKAMWDERRDRWDALQEEMVERGEPVELG